MYEVTEDETYTNVAVPDGNVRIYEPMDDTDDASRMYVLDVLGAEVIVRWVKPDPDDEDGKPTFKVIVDHEDYGSARPFTGEMWVGSQHNLQEWGEITADEVA